MLKIPYIYHINKIIHKITIFSVKSQKVLNIITKLKDQQSINKISDPVNHQTLLQLIRADTCSQVGKFTQYQSVKDLFELYLEEMKKKIDNSTNNYDPYLIRDQTKRISQLMNQISKYPRFNLNTQQIRYTYQIFCRHLASKSDQQMNKALKFVLRVDSRAEQSVVYEQFLKFYLGEKLQVLKAKYQLNLNQQSIGNLIKGTLSGIIHRGFLRRTPNYIRNLQVIYPSQILKLILQNKSTRDSLLIRKIISQQIFKKIVKQYQQDMHQNLYHEKNTKLWQVLNQNIDIIFNRDHNKLLQKQCVYLRQLYITLYLVLVQQHRIQPILKQFSKLGYVYEYFITNSYNSQKVSQFCAVFKQFSDKLNQNDVSNLLEFVQINQYMFSLIRNFDNLGTKIMDKLSQNLVPLTFSVYFKQLILIFQKWNRRLLNRLQQDKQQNLMKLLTLQQYQQLTMETTPMNATKIYLNIIQIMVNRDYKDQLYIKDTITMLKIYARHQQYGISMSQELKMLRIFLFRYISDHKNLMNIQQLEQVINIVLKLQDQGSFDDQYGNYNMSIYQQLATTNTRLYILLPSQLTQKLQQKTKNKHTNINTNTISQLLNRIKK